MFKIYKEWLKYKILCLLKDKLLSGYIEQQIALDRMDEHKNREYKGCVSKERFEKSVKESVEFFHGEYVKAITKCDVIKDVIDEVEKL